MEQIPVTVICSTYNGPRYLEFSLISLSRQTQKNFELIICDDGSGPETERLINRYKENYPVPLIHLWQEDNGFRKSKIHNEAIRKSKGDLLIFMDGDCVVGPEYVRDHYDTYLKEHKRPYVFMGRRVEVGPKLSSELTPDNLLDYLRPWSVELAKSCLKGDSRNFFRAISIKNPIVRKILKSDKVKDLLGCNFSTPKYVMEGINGFDEDYVKYWGEDGDVFVRLRNYGCKLIGKKAYGVQYHLYHSRRPFTPEQEAIYNELLARKDYSWAQNGLVKSQSS